MSQLLSASLSLQPSSPTTVVLLTLAGALVVRSALLVLRELRVLGSLPKRVILLYPNGLTNFLLPRVPGVTAGYNFLFVEKRKRYEQCGSDVFSITSILPSIQTTLLLSDAETIKEVTSSRARFPKPIELYDSLVFFGENIVVSEAEEWKKYRKVSAPGFSDRNNKLVWQETHRVVEGLFEVWDGKGDRTVTIDNISDIALTISLFVIGAAGFGKRMAWTDTEKCPPGRRMTFQDSLYTLSKGVFLKLAVPNWAMNLAETTRKIQTAFEELEVYMREMINRSGEREDLGDLFTSLLEANTHDTSIDALSDRELMGNIFIFLIAGHESTGHTIALMFGLLALYPDEQDRLLDQIKEVCGDGNISFSKLPKLTRFSAVYNETLRLYPAVTHIPKKSAEDTTLTTTNSRGEKTVIPVPKGTMIAIDTPGLHYNPRYWENPYEFNPDRFLKEYNKDAFVPFSSGVRSCLGRKFFETEAVITTLLFIRRYKISVKEEPQFAHETFEQRKERVMRCKPGLTLTPARIPLVFTRRDHIP
ncbi:614/534 cytochrome P450 [Coprinopsis cinerea AmutBmut pab1-1]|nr:614/534 cytochrome P450 [Coprinopsis cinerea AmutBmut pab1-1]